MGELSTLISDYMDFRAARGCDGTSAGPVGRSLDIRNDGSTCQRSWYLAITSAALGMHHGAGGWAIA